MQETRQVPPEVIEAIKALQESGILPTDQDIAKWLKEHGKGQWPQDPGQTGQTDTKPAEQAEPSEQVQRAESPVRKPSRGGRPPIEKPWLQEAARLVAEEGMSLPEALKHLGIDLSGPEIENIRRLVRFRHFYEKYRQRS